MRCIYPSKDGPAPGSLATHRSSDSQTHDAAVDHDFKLAMEGYLKESDSWLEKRLPPQVPHTEQNSEASLYSWACSGRSASSLLHLSHYCWLAYLSAPPHLLPPRARWLLLHFESCTRSRSTSQLRTPLRSGPLLRHRALAPSAPMTAAPSRLEASAGSVLWLGLTHSSGKSERSRRLKRNELRPKFPPSGSQLFLRQSVLRIRTKRQRYKCTS